MNTGGSAARGEPARARRIRVLCVDDHAFLVDGLRARFSLEPDIEVVGDLRRADELVAAALELKPDIVLLDIDMPGMDPFEAAEDVRRRCAGAKVVILSAHVREHYVNAAYKAGACGYFSKSDEPASLVAGLRKAARGEFALGPKVLERVEPASGRLSQGAGAGLPGAPRTAPDAGGVGAGEAAPPPALPTKLASLTKREQEVLRMIGRGLSRAEIAKSLCRSAKTVDGHRERIMAKLDIHTGPELVRYAIREGLAEA